LTGHFDHGRGMRGSRKKGGKKSKETDGRDVTVGAVRIFA